MALFLKGANLVDVLTKSSQITARTFVHEKLMQRELLLKYERRLKLKSAEKLFSMKSFADRA